MKTDTQLQRDVLAELVWQPRVDAAHIGVSADNGVVTLTGEVAHYSEKIVAGNTAKRVHGVKAIANDIEIKVPGSARRSDTEIATAALESLKWDIEVPDDRIKLTVQSGWVTLEGSVDWQYQKDAAERCIRHLSGVGGVNNSIMIKPEAKPAVVKGKIEDAFRRSASLHAQKITVDARGGRVTLRGNVSSSTERDEAESAAWAAPGVVHVDDQLEVVP